MYNCCGIGIVPLIVVCLDDFQITLPRYTDKKRKLESALAGLPENVNKPSRHIQIVESPVSQTIHLNTYTILFLTGQHMTSTVCVVFA